MELKKVSDALNYEGTLYYFVPNILDAVGMKIKSVVKSKQDAPPLGGMVVHLINSNGEYVSGGCLFIPIGDRVYNDEVEINTGLRLFTTEDEADKAMKDYFKDNSYLIIDETNNRLKRLKERKTKIEEEEREIKELQKICYEHLLTSFSKKT